MSDVIGVGGVGVGLVIAGVDAYFSETRRANRRIQRERRAAAMWPIAELPDHQLGWVVGRARALHEPMRSPLTGRRCVYYAAKVDENAAYPVLEERHGVPFVVEDDSGRAVVEPSNAELTVAFDRWLETDARSPASPAAEALLARHGRTSRTAYGVRWLTFAEAVIEVDQLVAVFGGGVRELDPDQPPAGYRSSAPTRIRLAGSRRHPLAITSAPDRVACRRDRCAPE
jgi:hypothetical protein